MRGAWWVRRGPAAEKDGKEHHVADDANRLTPTRVGASAWFFADGDPIRIWNDRGDIRLTALISNRIPAGVVSGRLDWPKLSPGGQNVNALTSERLTDIGRAATFYSTLVEVAKA